MRVLFNYCVSTVRFYAKSADKEVRVRFAPSPTGKLHLGGLRTALYNYLFAKKYNGKFILRIEDTDRERLLPGADREIGRLLEYYGLHCDESPFIGGSSGPYYQSERLDKYDHAIRMLFAKGKAYRCFCPPERLDLLRKDAIRKGENPIYDSHCRYLSEGEISEKLEKKMRHVIRFKFDVKEVEFQDHVFGDISHLNSEGDFIIRKSDLYPTYHLANVVDDHLMGISHVIRGMEWLSSTPKHVQIYNALEWSAPKWLHLSHITRDGTKKLSKRDKDAFVEYYIEKGYLSLAVINKLVRNGSGIQNFDSTHLYTLDELIKNFDERLITKRNLMLDTNVLNRLGREAFREANVENVLIPEIRNRLQIAFPDASKELLQDSNYIKRVISFLFAKEEKFSHLSELTDGDFTFFFLVPSSSGKVLANFRCHHAVPVLKELCVMHEWDIAKLRKLSTDQNLAFSKLMLLMRLSLIDSSKGPPIMELYEFFGEHTCKERLRRMISMLEKDI